MDIPVFALSKDDAVTYLATRNEWADDGGLDDMLGLGAAQKEGRKISDVIEAAKPFLSVANVIEITDPKMSPFNGSTICWCDPYFGEMSLGAAFFYESLRPFEEDISSREDSSDAEWDVYFKMKDKSLPAKFDAIRNDGVSLKRAYALARGGPSVPDAEYDLAKMRAVARVLADRTDELGDQLIRMKLGLPLDEDDSPSAPLVH